MNKKKPKPKLHVFIGGKSIYPDVNSEVELNGFIEYLEAQEESLKKTYENIEIVKIQIDTGSYIDNGSYTDFRLRGYRIETDTEYDARMERMKKEQERLDEINKKRKEDAEKKEKKLYEQLKKKYEK